MSAVLAVSLFTLMYWLFGGAGECSPTQSLKTIVTFTAGVIFLDFFRRIGMWWTLKVVPPLIGIGTVISGASLMLLLALIWFAPRFYYHNGYYLYSGTWLDMSCITVDDTYLIVMTIVGPAFGLASFACDMWLMWRWEKEQVRAN